MTNKWKEPPAHIPLYQENESRSWKHITLEFHRIEADLLNEMALKIFQDGGSKKGSIAILSGPRDTWRVIARKS